MSLWRRIRILILLLILFVVALNEFSSHSRGMDWTQPLLMVIYPFNADGDPRTQAYIDKLDKSDFRDIQDFLKREAKRYGLANERHVDIDLASTLQQAPPAPPHQGGVLDIMLWSLKLRWFAWSQEHTDRGTPDIQIFVSYHHPDNVRAVPHSLGLKEGKIGSVHAFAHRKQTPENNIVITHEMLHTLGASDKYDLNTLQPLFPLGYAEPKRSPLLPQRYAEIMAGRRPISQQHAEMPHSLKGTSIGIATAIEIGLHRLEDEK